MAYEPANAPKWRIRAQLLREQAEREARPEARENLLKLAVQWELKAAEAETPPLPYPGPSNSG